jgi:hypothetical protein
MVLCVESRLSTRSNRSSEFWPHMLPPDAERHHSCGQIAHNRQLAQEW